MSLNVNYLTTPYQVQQLGAQYESGGFHKLWCRNLDLVLIFLRSPS